MFAIVSATNSHYQTELTIENWNTLFTQPSDLIVQVTIRAGVRVLSYSNWLIIFLPTNEKPSSFSLSTNDKPPYIQ